MPLITANSFAMWTLAWDARNRAVESARTNPGAFTGDAIAAIIQAAASTEGFINELADAVRTEEDLNSESSQKGGSPTFRILPQLSAFAQQQAELEESHSRTTCKFVAALETLSGQPFDRGKRLYNDFADVMKLRDTLMHLRTRDRDARVLTTGCQEPTITIQPPEGRIKFIKRLMQKGLTWKPENDAKIGVSWFDLIQTPKMADWACRSARDIILAILDLVPDSRTDTSRTYKDRFRRIAATSMQESPSLA